MFDRRTRLSFQVADEVRRHLDGTVYDTVVPRSVRLSRRRAMVCRSPCTTRRRGAHAYEDLAAEVAARA